jgi:hypothetical protein
MLCLVLAFIIAAILLFSRKEGFSVHFEADGGIANTIHGGVRGLVRHAGKQAQNLKSAAVSMVPFRHKLRQWHRSLFKKNIGLVYA